MFPLKKESELIRRLNLPRDEEEKSILAMRADL